MELVLQHAPQLLTAYCVPLGYGCSLEVGFVLGVWLPSCCLYQTLDQIATSCDSLPNVSSKYGMISAHPHHVGRGLFVIGLSVCVCPVCLSVCLSVSCLSVCTISQNQDTSATTFNTLWAVWRGYFPVAIVFFALFSVVSDTTLPPFLTWRKQ